jgi:hypothetical protein
MFVDMVAGVQGLTCSRRPTGVQTLWSARTFVARSSVCEFISRNWEAVRDTWPRFSKPRPDIDSPPQSRRVGGERSAAQIMEYESFI